MANIFRGAFYVPRPQEDIPWLGKPIGLSTVLLVSLLPNFIGIAGLSVQPKQRYDHVPEPFWQGSEKGIPLAQLYLPAQPPFTIAGTRKFNLVPEPDWLGEPEPIPNVLLQLPAKPPFTIRPTQRFDYVPDPDWRAASYPVPLTINLPLQATLPFANPRSFVAAEESYWKWSAPNYQLLSVRPFSNPRSFFHVPDPNPSQASFPIPLAMLQLPAIPSPTIKGTRQFHVPDDVPWSMHGIVSAALYIPPSVAPTLIIRTLTGVGL